MLDAIEPHHIIAGAFALAIAVTLFWSLRDAVKASRPWTVGDINREAGIVHYRGASGKHFRGCELDVIIFEAELRRLRSEAAVQSAEKGDDG